MALKAPFSCFYLGNKKFLLLEKPIVCELYYSNRVVNPLLQNEQPFTPQMFADQLENEKIFEDSSKTNTVYHFTYEWGHFYNNQELLGQDELLAIKIQYNKSQVIDFKKVSAQNYNVKFIEFPVLKSYEYAFNKARQCLLLGECYQLNLTNRFKLRILERPDEKKLFDLFVSKSDHLSAYSHFSYIPNIELILFSNSPEGLFQKGSFKGEESIYSMPIKGTYRLKENEDWKILWIKLIKDKKNGAELDMITDMIRNDLSKIANRPSIVRKRKSPLIVPQILHQYSLVSTKLLKEMNLGSVLNSLFPGGSITGAPKKRVMKLLFEIENIPRKFYCGSTFLRTNTHFASSINIRTAEINLSNSEIELHAGGGITLLSECKNEYEEMNLKISSFLDCFFDLTDSRKES
ncbi:MAG: chorismate-binding protein [Halobacteriovoraceae bacterium]|nr:chorismate-binding protein [Halobacteriovoraceae bacterium]